MSRLPKSISAAFQQLYAATLFYPTFAWNFLLGRVLHVRNWWDAVEPLVILGARPFCRDVKPLHDLGVRAVVNTCAEYAGPQQEYDRFGIEQLHVPTTDFTPPNLTDVSTAVEFMQRHIAVGNGVYVHCKAGRARSATIVLCWLIKYRGLSPDDAQRRLLAVRPHVHTRLTERTVVRQFIAQES